MLEGIQVMGRKVQLANGGEIFGDDERSLLLMIALALGEWIPWLSVLEITKKTLSLQACAVITCELYSGSN